MSRRHRKRKPRPTCLRLQSVSPSGARGPVGLNLSAKLPIEPALAVGVSSRFVKPRRSYLVLPSVAIMRFVLLVRSAVVRGAALSVASLSGLAAGWGCFAGCSGSTGRTGSTASATFTAIYAQILSVQCEPCHSTGSDARETGLLMDTRALAYTNLVGDGGGAPAGSGSSCSGYGLRVDPGHAQTSLLIQKLTENAATTPPLQCGSPMPLDETPLSSSDIDEIEGWINEGAPNN